MALTSGCPPDGALPRDDDGRERVLVRLPPPVPTAFPDFSVRIERAEPTDQRYVADPRGAWLAARGPDGGFWLADRATARVLFRSPSDDPTATILLGDGGNVLVRVGQTRVEGWRVEPDTRSVDTLAP